VPGHAPLPTWRRACGAWKRAGRKDGEQAENSCFFTEFIDLFWDSMGFYQHMEKRWNKHALSPKHGNYDWNIMDFTPTKIPWEGDLQSGGLCNISHKWM
jgi:hypothetical protein